MTTRKIEKYTLDFSQQPQPDESWSPAGVARPDWDSPSEHFLAWFEQQDHDFADEQELVAEAGDDVLDNALHGILWLTAVEKRAVLDGYRNHLSGGAAGWKALQRALRSGEASQGLAVVVAGLIEHGAFHKTSARKKVSKKLDPTETKNSISLYKRMLHRLFPKKSPKLMREKAVQLLAHAKREAGESIQDAEARVESAYLAGRTPLKLLIEDVERAELVTPAP
ncbi:hypothetical protein NKI88_03165 [Mesorhizobium sp. M0317]|uniref:hypothetical protein n=1 Tax=Mesorhizobium sp. M0317 TaxID=2956935 RepID=UPI0033378E8F